MLYKELFHRLKFLKNIPLLLFILSGLTATIGNGLVYITTSWFAFEYFNSIKGVAFFMLCMWGPGIIGGPLFGICADKYNRKYLLVLSNITRGLAICLFALYSFLGFENNIFILALILGIFVAFYMPAAVPLITSIVNKEDLLRVNTTMDMIYEIGTVLGMGISGFLVHYVGSLSTLCIGGLLFIIAGILNMVMKYNHPQENMNAIKKSNFWGELIDATKYLSKNKNLINIHILQTLLLVLLMTIPVLLVPYTKDVLKSETSTFAIFESLYSLGVIIGCLIFPALCERISFKFTTSLLLVILSIALLFISLNYNYNTNCISYFLIGIGLSSWSLTISQAQIMTNINFQGRLQSISNSVSGIGILTIYLFMTLKGSYLNLLLLYRIEAILALFTTFLVIVSKYNKDK